MNNLDEIDLKTLIAKEKNGRMRIRLLALSQLKDGINKAQIARNLSVSRRIVNHWVKLFIEEGLDGLKEKPRAGRPSSLSKSQLAQVKEFVIKNSIKPDGGRLKGSLVVDYIQDNFGVKFGLNNIYRILHQLNLSWITSRSKHPKQSDEVQEAFKKIQKGNDP